MVTPLRGAESSPPGGLTLFRYHRQQCYRAQQHRHLVNIIQEEEDEPSRVKDTSFTAIMQAAKNEEDDFMRLLLPRREPMGSEFIVPFKMSPQLKEGNICNAAVEFT